MTADVYFYLGLLAIICIVLICMCIDHLQDIDDEAAPPPCNSADWQAIERQARAVQDKAQAELKTRPRTPPHTSS